MSKSAILTPIFIGWKLILVVIQNNMVKLNPYWIFNS